MQEEIWPSFRYGPDEQAQIFERAEDVPPGWADHPSKVKAGKKDDTTERRLPRPELMEALRQRGVQFAPNAGGAELAVLLAASEPQDVEVDSNGKALGVKGPEEATDPAQPGPNPLDPALAPPPPPPPEFPAPAPEFQQPAPFEPSAAPFPVPNDSNLPDSPPALAGKNKAKLLKIAKAEGVEFADDATNAELRDAIEAKRGN